MRTSATLEDTMGRYLDAIGAVPLLTQAQEVDCAKRIRAGGVAAARLDAGVTDAMEAARLRRIRQDGLRAESLMVRSNLRLVVSIARRYQGRGLDLIDLVQEGNLGLLRAIEKFDHRKGYRLSTYATWWIRQSVTRGIAARARTIRLPGRVHDLIGRLKFVETELAHDLGRAPTDEELAEEAGVSLDRLREIRRVMRSPVPLDTTIDDEGETTLGQLVADETAADPEHHATQVAAHETLHEVLATLDDRDRGILERRYGLGPHDPHTLERIGEIYGITRERIRQLERRSLSRLRTTTRLDGMVAGGGDDTAR